MSWCFEPIIDKLTSKHEKRKPKTIESQEYQKKVHTKALHSLLMMETVTLGMRAEHVTNIATPKGKLGIVLLVKEELAQVYFKTTHRLVRSHLQGERVPN